MISHIFGKIIGKGAQHIVLENSGIGYKIFTPPRILELAIGAEARLHTYFCVREDGFSLYGFDSAADLELFELLITVNGVGPKVALSILSSGASDFVRKAISAQDPAVFTKISGVGKKTAEKIILELKDKVGGGFGADSGAGSQKYGDILSALEGLGYTSREIKKVLPEIDSSLSDEDKIKQALKLLAN